MPIASPKLPIPDRLVVLTFDDGSISNAVFVAPLLNGSGLAPRSSLPTIRATGASTT